MRFFGEAAVPWLVPVAVLSLVIGVAASGRIGSSLGIGRLHAVVLVVALGVTLGTTLTPLRGVFGTGEGGIRGCDFSRLWFASAGEYLHANDRSMNVLLFVPLGAAIAAIPRPRPRTILFGAAILLPFVIETLQLLLPILDRSCESGDIIDNLTGLAIGGAIGWIYLRALR